LVELQSHLAPLVLGAGVRLFDGVSPELGLIPKRVIGSPQVTHLTCQIGARGKHAGQYAAATVEGVSFERDVLS
jgi:hypothetical protein